MTEPTVLIVGAGIGGLSTGCYARLNGLSARILEMHDRPGGLCTGWTRNGYVFDGCMHNLAGTAEDSRFRPMWRDLGVLPRVRMESYDELVRVERPDGPPLVLHTDLARLEAHLKSLSPSDAPAIEDFVEAARWFADFDLLGLAVARPAERAKAFAHAAPMMLKWGGVSLAEFAERFTDPFLRRAFPTLVYDWPDQSMPILLSMLGRAAVGDMGWPVGGAQAISQAIADRFLELGGEIRYGTKVASILVEGDRAVGVRLLDGREERADVVVSNAEGHATIFEMLGARYLSPAIRGYYSHPEDRCEMGIHVSLGIARDLSHEPHAIVLMLDRLVEIGGESRGRLYVEPFGFDPTLAPAGKAALKVVMATSHSRWEELARDPEAYAAEKAAIAQIVIDLLEPRFPGLKRQIETIDVATPITTRRFTGNGQGYRSPMERMIMAVFAGKRLSQTLPGLRGFYMVGQWAGVPGVPMVAAQGRDVVRQILRREGRALQAGFGDAA